MYLESQKDCVEFIASIVKHKDIKPCFSTILKSVSKAVIVIDLSGNVKYMNPLSEHLSGWKEHKAAGKPWKEVFNIIKENPCENNENHKVILISNKGLKIPIKYDTSLVIDDDGTIRGFFLIFSDIHGFNQVNCF